MIRTIVLLSPVFVSLFWAIALMGPQQKYGVPRLFLSKFMLLNGVIFAAHFLYFIPIPEVYVYFDPILQFVGLIIFPMYHIYIRLLTVDKKFSLRVHWPYLVIPVSIGLFYTIAVLITPGNLYRLWLYNQVSSVQTNDIYLLGIARKCIRITFAVQLFYVWIANHRLMKKYGDKAAQFYSDVEDGISIHVKLINYSILLICVFSFVYTSLGRDLLFNKDNLIYLGWSAFAITLYIIGYSGIRQNPINPTFEAVIPRDNIDDTDERYYTDQKKLADKIWEEFEKNKIHLNCELTIIDVGRIIGTNRTYVSTVINQEFNQNFCSFVNGFRIEELKKLLLDNPDFSMEDLAGNCGFGSVSSMKRAVFSKAGVSFNEFKNQLTK